MFLVEIKQETFKENGMQFLAKIGFEPNHPYRVLSVVGDKLLLVKEDGEMVELYPRKCKYVMDE
jgi:hypothetical protein